MDNLAPEMPHFAHYGLMIDARSPREFDEDHIPGAINLPVVGNEEFAEVGTTHKADRHRAYVIGVAHSLRNMAQAIDRVLAPLPRETKILVYCFRGGKRSKLWFDNLQTIGFRVDKLQGGWRAYRRWVNTELASLPPQFRYNVLSGPTGCGKTRLLKGLRAAGAQVLDLEDIARHRGSLIGAIPGVAQPTQKLFEGHLLRQLLEFDRSKPIWVEAESKKIGNIQIPPALFSAMHAGKVFRMDAPMEERVKLWREDYKHFEQDPLGLLERLQYLRPLVGGGEFAEWGRLAADQRMAELFERLMRSHYDPAYDRATNRHYPAIAGADAIFTASLAPAALQRIAVDLCTR
jgi:tRNA 2-selenouridine synthase